MKIGVITYWNSADNYGQLLQCYALQKYLRSIGHDAFLIRYLPFCKKATIIERVLRNLSWKRICYILSGKRKKDMAKMAKQREQEVINRELNKLRDFDGFRNRYIYQTELTYMSLQALKDNPPDADAYICGSDQVWSNDLKLSETAVWYLHFGGKDVKRIAYAASMGGKVLNNKEKKIFKRLLSNFTSISVREESSQELCVQQGYKDAIVSVDPTLLLPVDAYREIKSQKTAFKEPYLFIYALNIATSDEIYWTAIKQYLNEFNLGLRIVTSSGYVPAQELLDEYKNTQATIPEWLSLIDNSRCVVTTSFHGVVFCIKMHKPFLAVLLTNQHKKANIRITGLIESLGLSQRIFVPGKSVAEQMNQEIDWVMVEARLKEMSAKSKDFLAMHLS